MKYLVTGGAGFIGSHLVERLLEENNEVSVIDDFSTGKTENLPMNNKNLKVFDISILDDIDRLFNGVNIVFHLAAKTRPQESIADPNAYNLVNIDGTVNVLR